MKKSILTDGEVVDSLLFLDRQARDFRAIHDIPGNAWHVFLLIAERWKRGTRVINRHFLRNSGLQMNGSEISHHLSRLEDVGLLRCVLRGGKSFSYAMTVEGLDFLRFLQAELESRLMNQV